MNKVYGFQKTRSRESFFVMYIYFEAVKNLVSMNKNLS